GPLSRDWNQAKWKSDDGDFLERPEGHGQVAEEVKQSRRQSRREAAQEVRAGVSVASVGRIDPDDHLAPGPEEPGEPQDGAAAAAGVMEHAETENGVEGAVGEGRIQNVAPDGVPSRRPFHPGSGDQDAVAHVDPDTLRPMTHEKTEHHSPAAAGVENPPP